MQDVIIVGGGVVGLSLARALARAGAGVTLLERAPASDRSEAGPSDGTWPSDGASSLPVALINPWRGRKGAAHPDDLDGLAATWRWAEELTAEGLDPGAGRDGLLRVPTSERQARSWRERAAEEPELDWMAAGAVPAAVHAPFGALRVRDGGAIRPDAWRTALAASARGAGATLRSGATAGRLERDVAGWRIVTAEGEVHAARTVILSIGADAPPEVRGAGGSPWPDWIRTRGEEVAVAAAGPPLPVAGGIYAAPDGDRTWVGGGHRPADRDDPDAPRKLREAMAWSVPGLANAPVTEVWSGVRAKRADARPVIEAWRDGVWIVGAFAGRGFLCAALEAERFANAWRAGRR
jgi:glycine/D-amino acid oxidase-like deaminating enzyme